MIPQWDPPFSWGLNSIIILLATNKSHKLQLLTFTCTSQNDGKIKICRTSCVLREATIRS